MDFIINTVDGLNWWAIVVAALAAMPVGFVWYDLKMGFGKRWAKLNGLKEKDLENTDGMATRFAIMIGFAFATAFVLACLIKTLGIESFWDSLVFGLIIGIVFRSGAHFIHNGFTRKPMELTLLDAGHDMVSIAIMAVIVGLWK